MHNTDAFERDYWHDRRVGRPLHREMTFTQAGLAVGRCTILAKFEREGRAAGGLALDGNEARLLSLLTATYREPLAGGVIEFAARANICARAKKRWRKSISPPSACRRSMRRAPTASSSRKLPSKKASAQAN